MIEKKAEEYKVENRMGGGKVLGREKSEILKNEVKFTSNLH